MRSSLFSLLLLAAGSWSAPTAAPEPTSGLNVNSIRDAKGGILASVLNDVKSGLVSDANQASQIASVYLDLLEETIPTATPASLSDVPSYCSKAIGTSEPSDILDSAVSLVKNGFKPNDLTTNVIGSFLSNINEQSPNNPAPKTKLYPVRPNSSDAKYSLPESTLRSSIYIPPTFQYGAHGIQPILLVPGTGTFGGSNFASNFIKLLRTSGLGDPVWLNIPAAVLNDAQLNAEHVAYATAYIHSLTNTPLALVAWSQGTLLAQWALKYWPSMRPAVTDLVAISPDFHGTVNAYFLCPGFPETSCAASVRQQEYGSEFVEVLRRDGGDSAYVPTTNVYSRFFDEIVEPQTENNASGALFDARGVGVSNNLVQTVCGGRPAGGFFTHEGVLYNSLAWALAKDALMHEGPASLERIDLGTVCNEFAAPGLSLEDVLATEGIIPMAAVNVLIGGQRTFVEPPIKGYAK